MNILFITSNSTGQGHKSITEAVSSQLKRLAPDVNISVIDGFTEGNALARASGRIYNTIAVYFPLLWGLLYRFCDFAYRLINKLTIWCTEKGVMNAVMREKPDIIISVHAAFVGSVLSILEKHRLSVPLIPIIADLDNVSSMWYDKRAAAIICPTQEAKQKMALLGMPEEKLVIYDFPLRKQFTEPDPAASSLADDLHFDSDKPLALLINGSQGSPRSVNMVKTLLKAESCNLCVVTGSNKQLRELLEICFKPYLGKRLKVIGYTHEMDKYMRAADFLIARASPNVLMEAVFLRKPVIATGAFHGQEEKNPAFIENHKLGVFCKKIALLPEVVRALTANDGAKLKEISENQAAFYKSDSTIRIAAFLLQCIDEDHNGNLNPYLRKMQISPTLG